MNEFTVRRSRRGWADLDRVPRTTGNRAWWMTFCLPTSCYPRSLRKGHDCDRRRQRTVKTPTAKQLLRFRPKGPRCTQISNGVRLSPSTSPDTGRERTPSINEAFDVVRVVGVVADRSWAVAELLHAAFCLMPAHRGKARHVQVAVFPLLTEVERIDSGTTQAAHRHASRRAFVLCVCNCAHSNGDAQRWPCAGAVCCGPVPRTRGSPTPLQSEIVNTRTRTRTRTAQLSSAQLWMSSGMRPTDREFLACLGLHAHAVERGIRISLEVSARARARRVLLDEVRAVGVQRRKPRSASARAPRRLGALGVDGFVHERRAV